MEDILLMEHLKKDHVTTISEHEELLEKAFKEGCEHGYHKAMMELKEKEHTHHTEKLKEGFEERIARLKEKYK